MKAIARRTNNSFTHRIEVRNHQLTVDEPTHHGPVEVEVEFSPAERGVPVEFDIVMRLSSELSEEQVERLQVIAGKCTARSRPTPCSTTGSS
jgi:hypothetical protein